MVRVTRARRRWLGAICLAGAVGLLVAGDATPGGRLGAGAGFVAYWLLCFLLCIAAVGIAWWDLRALRREIHDEQRAMLETALRRIDREGRNPQSRKQGRSA